MSVRDRWMNGRQRTAAYGTGQRWEVRWRDAGDQQRKRRFALKDDALAFDLQQRRMPTDWGATLADLWGPFIARRANLAPGTLRSYTTAWSVHVEPRWSHLRPQDIRPRDVELWAAGIAAPAARRRAVWLLTALLRDGGVALNVRPGQSPRRVVEPLSDDEVGKLADACGPHRLVPWLLATTGARFGEMAALRVGSVDAARGRLRITRQFTTAGGTLEERRPKSGRARETVIPSWLVAELDLDRPRDVLLLPTRSGGPWRASSWKRVWGPARKAAGLPDVRTHDLRHTFACRMIDAGVDLKTLQRMMGHSTLSLTVDLYGERAASHLERVPDAFSEGAFRAHRAR